MRILITFSPTPSDARLLDELCKGHELVLARDARGLSGVEVIFGQPDPVELLSAESVRLVHLSSAGYTSYDRDDLRQRFRARGSALTNSSGVYAEPCAEHALMFMLAHARAFPLALLNENGPRGWPQGSVREKSCLLKDETVLIAGFGAIGQRLAALLSPFTKNLRAVRRRVRGDESIETHPIEELIEILPRAKHVVNTLPDNPTTRHLFDEGAFSRMNEAAVFYNVGRGSTVDQDALLEALHSGTLAAAYLDVCTPEPLPPDHPLWSAPNCHVTPHSAGGHVGEPERLIRHFADNLQRLERGTPLLDRVY
jgi:phosphoglycerate dehydrogenase-like enzyme